MSVITSIMLFIKGNEDYPQKILEVNRYLETLEDRGLGWNVTGLVSVDAPVLPRGWYGGDKLFVDGIYIGAYNYLEIEPFLQHLTNITWESSDPFQLFLMEEEDDDFRVIKLSDIEGQEI